MIKLGKPISLRLPVGLDKQLRELAKSRSIEFSSYVRRILIEHISQTGKKIDEKELYGEISGLKEKLALSVEALLITAGKQSEEKARSWVNRKIREVA